jgi:Ca2+-binding EF-hand superfamily protein
LPVVVRIKEATPMDTASISSQPSLIIPGVARAVGVHPMPRPSAPAQTPEPAASETAPRRMARVSADQGDRSVLERMKADWGKSESPWDLNGDGTVNIRDLLHALATMGARVDNASPPSPTNAQPEVQTSPQPFDDGQQPDRQTWIERLRAHWGETGSPWDLNGDGTVNVRDLLKAVAMMGGDGRQADAETWIERLRADWGKADSPWDLNGDGTVNVRDLLRALATRGSDGDDQQPAAASWIDQLRADWGKADSPWDLNFDGTVNVRDLLELLATTRRDPQRSEAPERHAPRVGHELKRARAAYGPPVDKTTPAARGLAVNAVG